MPLNMRARASRRLCRAADMRNIQVSPRDLEPQQTGGRKRAERPIGVDDRKGANNLAMTLCPVEFIPARFLRKQSRYGRSDRDARAPKERFADCRGRGNQTAPLLLGLSEQLVDELVIAMGHELPPPFGWQKRISRNLPLN